MQSATLPSHPIFLSHSGHDKPFVRRLYNALRHAGHRPFLDTHCLPAGEPFPTHIFQNASACQLGVVVLSANFLTSRWPMMELHCMHTSLSHPTILPLFFKLSPSDVKLSSPRFVEWREAWKTFEIQSPSRVNLSQWEAAVTNLATLHGVDYQPNEGEDIFIEKTLHHISSIVRPHLRYRVSHLTGCERLTQEVATLFEGIGSSSHFEAHAIGLYGVGGQGKTTICKLMVHHYAAVYAGRCTLIELPSADPEEAKVLTQCKKALKQFAHISDSRMDCIDNLDQCLQLLQERVADVDVFIAIDNIWENHLEFAQRIVDVGFSKGSKLLVTSRSRQVLTNLLKDGGSVRSLPRLNREEARQIFINSCNRNHCAELNHLEESDVDKMTDFFKFQYQYHPLAINALGVALGKMDKRDWPATVQDKMRHIVGSNVTKAIRLNYDSIPNVRRELFLDVALIYIPKFQGDVPQSRWYENFDPLHTWLSALYKGRMDGCEIRRALMQLTYDGLLEFEEYRGSKQVRVHELYIDFANQEAAESSRFVVQEQEEVREKDVKWAEAKRIVVEGDTLSRRLALPSLQLLMARNWECGRRPRLELMPQLRVLKVWNKKRSRPCWFWAWEATKVLKRHSPVGWKEQVRLAWRSLKEWKVQWHTLESVGWEKTPHLGWLELKGIFSKDISQLSDLLFLKLRECCMSSRRLCLDGLLNLQYLEIIHVRGIEEIMGFAGLINLKCMRLECLPDVRKVDNFTGHLTQLQVVEIALCDLLVDVKGLDLLPNLKGLHCTQDYFCNNDKVPPMFTETLKYLALHNVRIKEEINLTYNMAALELLELQHEGGTSVTGIHGNLPRLKLLWLSGEVKEIGDIGQLPSLESVFIVLCKGLKEIDWSSFHGVSCNLRYIHIDGCHDLKSVMGDPSCIANNLKGLEIKDCKNLEEVAGLELFINCEVIM